MMNQKHIEEELAAAGVPEVVKKTKAAEVIGISLGRMYEEIAHGNLQPGIDRGVMARSALALYMVQNPRIYARFLENKNRMGKA